MKRFLKIFRVLFLVGLVLVLAGLVFWVFFLPGIVENEVESLLAGLGLRPVECKVRGLSTSHVTLSAIHIGEERRLKVGNVDVEFDIEGLSTIRLGTVRVTGAVLDVRYEGGEIDLGPLHDLETGDSEGDGELPFERVELAASAILLRTESGIDRIPIDGTLANLGGGVLHAVVRTRLLGREVWISGDLESVASKLRAEVRSDLCSAQIDYDWSGPGDRLRAVLVLDDQEVDTVVGGLRLRADRVMVAGSFALEDFETVTSSDLQVVAEGARLDGTEIGTARLTCQKHDDALRLTLRGGRHPDSDEGAVVRLVTDAPLSIADLADPDLPRRFTLSVEGDVPGEVADLVRKAGMDPGAPFTVHAQGDGVFQWRSGDYEVAFSLTDLQLRAGPDPVHPRLLVETFQPGQIAYDASGKLRLRLPRLWTEVVTPEVTKFVDPGLLAAAGLHLEADGDRIVATFDYETDDHLVFRHGNLEARSAWLRLAGKAVLTGGVLTALDARTEVRADWLGVPSAEIVVRGVEAAFPVLRGPAEATLGLLTTGEIILGGRRFPGISGTIRPKSDALGLDARWPVDENIMVMARGDARRADGGLEGRIDVWANPFPVGAEDRVGRLLTELTGLSFDGKVEIDGSLPLEPGAAHPAVRARLSECTISVPDGESHLSGVNFSLTLGGPSPFHSPGAQTIEFSGGRLGGFKLGSGAVAFRVEAPYRILIEDARWELGGEKSRPGRFWARPFRFDPANPVIDTTLFCEGFDLGDWMSLVAPEGATGRGKLYGRVPFRLATEPKLSATLGEGYLFAEGGGWLRVRGTEKYVKENLPAVGAAAEYTEIVQSRIIHALENFDFEKLRFDLLEEEDGLTLRVTVLGSGAEVLEGTVGKQELDLTLNFNGVDALIGPALDASLGIKELREMLERLLKGDRR